MSIFKLAVRIVVELLQLPILLVVSLGSRLSARPIDIGLGPEPMINNVYHKKALQCVGYSAETFVDSCFFITDEFDWKIIPASDLIRRLLRESNYIYLFSIFRYRCLYLYFNGGALYATALLWRFEPLLYRVAGVRTVVMPYGGDVQDMLRTPNLMFRHVVSQDYPLLHQNSKKISHKIDIWCSRADHIISGCDWVDYMPFWNTLMIAHFSIDTKLWKPSSTVPGGNYSERPLRILHAPNHRSIKGSDFFIRAVEELRAEGALIELILVQGLPNVEIRRLIESVDLVADQLIIGWYAMFAIEAMAMGKPVLCYLREDLERLYIDAGLLQEKEVPLINCRPATVKETLRMLMQDPARLVDAASRGPAYVKRHHSLEAVGAVFADINRKIGLPPRGVMEVRP